ncbi:hypothetical protein [Prevotella pallens]|uniref:hypothetical protein n=1 Tax=Prevotella pallens TaxID=60133 RepID=UPI0028894643|nr:hypothetical protein [Prevotella pallens]
METVLLGQGGQHQDGVVRINYKSDFPLEVKVVRNGVAENFPDADFTLTAKTEGGFTVYKAERKAGVYSHCKRDGERLIMFFDNHGLAKGRLIVSAVINHPDADYTEDGIRQENLTTTTNIELVEDNGDALQLQLPEPRVVEKVVEKIVEKETDHYTDLQKKAAAWVAGLDTSGDSSYPLILDYFLKNITDIGSLTAIFQGGYMNGANETDPDFNEKLKLAKVCFDTPYLTITGTNCFEGMNAPHLDLDLFSMGLCDISNSFYYTIVNTLTINAQGFFISYSIPDDNQDVVIDSLFLKCVAKKVRITKNNQSNKNVYYYLATIKDSKVECFEFKEENKEHALDINIVAEKILPDVSQNDHKPKLIFRNVVGTVNEELKQKILAKGYPSVEFYEGENKVL